MVEFASNSGQHGHRVFWLATGSGRRVTHAPVYIRASDGWMMARDQRHHAGHHLRLPSSDAPLEYGPRKKRSYNRFVRLTVRGISERVLWNLRAPAARRPSLAGQHAYQGPRVGRAGRRKGGFAWDRDEPRRRDTRVHLIADAHGRPKVVALRPAVSATIACRRGRCWLDCRPTCA